MYSRWSISQVSLTKILCFDTGSASGADAPGILDRLRSRSAFREDNMHPRYDHMKVQLEFVTINDLNAKVLRVDTGLVEERPSECRCGEEARRTRCVSAIQLGLAG